MKTYHITVQGRVQGVGFRYFTLQRAQSLGVRGWVRNLADGSVEIMVSGAGSPLEKFIDAVKNGPSFSRVDDVVVSEKTGDDIPLPATFTIK